MELVVKEYLGNGIQFEVTDGEVYANAQEMCRVFGKDINQWKRKSQTQRYLSALEQKAQNGKSTKHVIVVNDGKVARTMIHEKLILKLAQWLDVDFEIWCDEQIATLLREGSVSVAPKTRADMMLELFGNTPQTHAMIQLDEKLEIAIKTKAEIGSKREATAMATASVKSREANKYKKVIETEITKYRPAHIIKRYNLGISSRKFNALLESQGVQYKQKNLWYPCEGYEGMLVEYTDSITGYKATGWTDKGVEVILEVFNNLGIYN